MGAKWIDFFETNNKNMLNGYLQDFRHSLFKTAFINDSANSLALVSCNPPLGKAIVEIYTISDKFVDPMLKGLFRILRRSRIAYTRVTILNIKDHQFINNINSGLLNQMDYALQMMFMGKYLNSADYTIQNLPYPQ
jgi:hypothetical protein